MTDEKEGKKTLTISDVRTMRQAHNTRVASLLGVRLCAVESVITSSSFVGNIQIVEDAIESAAFTSGMLSELLQKPVDIEVDGSCGTVPLSTLGPWIDHLRELERSLTDGSDRTRVARKIAQLKLARARAELAEFKVSSDVYDVIVGMRKITKPEKE